MKKQTESVDNTKQLIIYMTRKSMSACLSTFTSQSWLAFVERIIWSVILEIFTLQKKTRYNGKIRIIQNK